MPEALQRQIGPFKLWQWLLIVAVGIGLGLLVRAQMANKSSPTTPAVGPKSPSAGPGDLPTTQGAPTIIQQDSQQVRDLREETGRLAGELEDTRTTIQNDFDSLSTFQKEQDRLADELESRNTRQNEFFADIRERISAINVPVAPKAKTVKLSDLEQARNQFRNFFGIEPSSSESAAKLLRRIKQGRKDRNLANAREAFRKTFGIEPSMQESAAKLRRRIGDAGKDL